MTRATRFAAADFLRFDNAQRMHEILSADGFVLRHDAHGCLNKVRRILSVRLVWRNATTHDSVLLTLRIKAGA